MAQEPIETRQSGPSCSVNGDCADAIDPARRIAFWGGLFGAVIGLLMLRNLNGPEYGLDQVTLYTLATVPPFAFWGLTLLVAQRLIARRDARQGR
ncbi:hypothetical protein [Zavarzinia sp.]|uniref:hypothetical protein n=1 Tax=Zavarzinia sp. TaxID=2027920 RepID=UPI0035680293